MIAREYDATLWPDRTKNLYATPYYGLWSRNVSVKHGIRRFLTYTPETYFPNQRVIYLVMPAGLAGETFLDESVWSVISEETGTVLVLAEAGKQGNWGTWEEEEEYLEKVLLATTFSPREESIAVNSDGHYLVAYGEGADVAIRYLLKRPATFSASVIAGAKEVEKEFVEGVGHLPVMTQGLPKEECAPFRNCDCRQPVWLVGEENEELLAYLKEANHVGERTEWNGFAKVYREIPTPYFDTLHRRPVSCVCVTRREGAKSVYRDEKFTRALWDCFLSRLIRYGEGPVGALKYYISCADVGISVFREKMYHDSFKREVERMYALYVPTSYQENRPCPLVVATHGYTGTYDYFVRNTELWRVAEERGFIVAFTQAVPDQTSRCGTPRWRSGYKNANKMFPETDTKEAFDCEVAYFRRVVERICEEYAIDRTRIYCTGHSNGSEMTYGISQEMKDVFAATAMVGFAVQEYENIEDMPSSAYKMPYLNIEHSGDFFINPDDPDSPLYHELCWRKRENGIAPDGGEYDESDNGTYKIRQYCNTDGVPLVNYIYYRRACHCYLPETGYVVWDRFFCDFTRGTDGATYYRGKPC